MEATDILHYNYEDYVGICIEDFQNIHDIVLVPPDEVDECGGEIYGIPSCHNSAMCELNKNKYYPWINKEEFWITE